MKVAVTGASGHVGACLCRKLIDQGYEVRALLHNDDKGINGLALETVKGDLMDEESLDKLCREVDVVFHLAAKIAIDKSDPDAVSHINVQGTKNILNSSKRAKVKKFIHFSSAHALTEIPLDQEVNEESPLNVNSRMAYEKTKANGEQLVLKAAEEGLNAAILNPTAIIGPYDYKLSLLGQAVIKIALNKLPMLVPGGYDWVDVRDVADAAVKAIEKSRKGERYILSGNWHSLKELSTMIGQVNGYNTTTMVCPTFVAKIGLPFIHIYSKIRNEEPLYTADSLNILKNSNRNISHKKASAELDYNPRELEYTLKETLNWFSEHNMLS